MITKIEKISGILNVGVFGVVKKTIIGSNQNMIKLIQDPDTKNSDFRLQMLFTLYLMLLSFFSYIYRSINQPGHCVGSSLMTAAADVEGSLTTADGVGTTITAAVLAL